MIARAKTAIDARIRELVDEQEADDLRFSHLESVIDPRRGDVEDDASSTKQRSLLGLAGGFLAEISFPKLLLAGLLLIVVPGVLLGLAPLVVSGWVAALSGKITAPILGVWPLLLLALLIAAGWWGGRRLFRAVEQAFWALNSLAVQPGYLFCREGLRHLAYRWMPGASAEKRARVSAMSAAGAGIVVCGVALLIIALVWPLTRWIGQVAIVPALANAMVLISAYLAVAALCWGIADATMAQPRDLLAFDSPPSSERAVRIWRIAHLSDVHVVGERYGFRIESGRAGPQGNQRFARVLAQLDAIHADSPLDLVIITGDMTDAGSSGEWAEFLSALAAYPKLLERTLMLPGNHDVNVVDRANPARLDLPTSPSKRLRQLRSLSAIAAVQGNRVHIVDADKGGLGSTLTEALEPIREMIETFADKGSMRLSMRLEPVWNDAFPMVLPPDADDGLGVILLNSNAETHFSFTNALGLIPSDQYRRLKMVFKQFPRACWIVALHHHLVEYPDPTSAFTVRIGTALINGTWFVRQLGRLGGALVAMHGHRHHDWIGECGGVRIISAPSPVMNATDRDDTRFHIHTLVAGPPSESFLAPERQLCLLEPEQVMIPGTESRV